MLSHRGWLDPAVVGARRAVDHTGRCVRCCRCCFWGRGHPTRRARASCWVRARSDRLALMWWAASAQVATGGASHEMLPVLLLVPRLSGPPGAYSMLGYGDVVLPGLLLVRQGGVGEGLGCVTCFCMHPACALWWALLLPLYKYLWATPCMASAAGGSCDNMLLSLTYTPVLLAACANDTQPFLAQRLPCTAIVLPQGQVGGQPTAFEVGTMPLEHSCRCYGLVGCA